MNAKQAFEPVNNRIEDVFLDPCSHVFKLFLNAVEKACNAVHAQRTEDVAKHAGQA